MQVLSQKTMIALEGQKLLVAEVSGLQAELLALTSAASPSPAAAAAFREAATDSKRAQHEASDASSEDDDCDATPDAEVCASSLLLPPLFYCQLLLNSGPVCFYINPIRCPTL